MEGDSDIFLVDTNVLIYAYEKEESEKRTRAFKLLVDCFSGRIKLAVSYQNLAEFVSAFTMKGRGDPVLVDTIVRDIVRYAGFIKLHYTGNTILLATSLMNQFKLPFWDSLLIATMKEHTLYNVYTENVRDFAVTGIRVVNPFVLL